MHELAGLMDDFCKATGILKYRREDHIQNVPHLTDLDREKLAGEVNVGAAVYMECKICVPV